MNDKTCAIAHCKRYGQDGRCCACDDGYALNNDALCETQDQYCDKYNNDRTACISCIKGYRVDKNGKCEYADEHCSYFD